MKKYYWIILLLIITPKINAQSILNFNWDVGNIGLGMNYSSSNDDNIEITVSVLNLIIEHYYSNVGLEFSPFKYWYVFEFQNEIETNGGKFSFINSNIYWNLLDNKRFILGPFMSINYFFVDTKNGINMNEYIFTSGLRFSYKYNYKIFFDKYSQIFSSEIGYRNMEGKNKFYFSISLDLIPALIGIGAVIGEDNRINNSNVD